MLSLPAYSADMDTAMPAIARTSAIRPFAACGSYWQPYAYTTAFEPVTELHATGGMKGKARTGPARTVTSGSRSHRRVVAGACPAATTSATTSGQARPPAGTARTSGSGCTPFQFVIEYQVGICGGMSQPTGDWRVRPTVWVGGVGSTRTSLHPSIWNAGGGCVDNY